MMSERVWVLALFAASMPMALCDAAPARSDVIQGRWATEGYGAVVEVDRCDGDDKALCGRLVWAWHPDELKPGALGSLMLEARDYDGERWTRARLSHPESGKTYRGSIRALDADRLEVRGCAAIFCATQVWRRLESLPHVPVPDQAASDSATPRILSRKSCQPNG